MNSSYASIRADSLLINSTLWILMRQLPSCRITSAGHEESVPLKTSVDPDQCFISKLSVELMLHIFEMGHLDSPARGELPWELLVSWTCRYWRVIALDHGPLWTKIDFRYSAPMLRAQAYLRRSKNAPLIINLSNLIPLRTQPEYYSFMPLRRSPFRGLVEALSLILPHVHRWQKFVCHLTHHRHQDMA